MFNTPHDVITSIDKYYNVDGKHVRHQSIQLT
jgi:hypothetical protein